MDTSTFTCITPEVRRLASFQRTPLSNQQKLSISYSPAKLAKAGFMRSTDAVKDDVYCEMCGIVFGDWAGESPFAVHRVLNENCPILINTPTDNVLQHPSVLSARRRLFAVVEHEDSSDRSEAESESDTEIPDDSIIEDSADREDELADRNSERMHESGVAADNRHAVSSAPALPSHTEPDNSAVQSESTPQLAYVSVLSPQASFTFPFKPRVGGFSMLFASRRQKTFSDSGCLECDEWAEEGFVFRTETNDVQCVFCELILPFDICEPRREHEEKSCYCPLVLYVDVGNISSVEEERIRLKNLQRQLKIKSSPNRHYAITYPQYEEESIRFGTFDNWPYSSWDDHLQPSLMSQAGFFYTGLADKVKCYSCGLGLHRWHQGSDPWEQHARHMPACPHLLAKGHYFIQQAAEAEVLTEADLPSASGNSSPDSGSGSPGELLNSSPGALTLDVCAVTAALNTSRFPTKDILLGTLKAAEENFTTVCQQRDALHQKDTVIQQKDTVIQQKDTVIQQKDTVIQQTYTELQQKETALQHQNTELQQHMGIVEQQNQIIQQHQLELTLREEALGAKEEELRTKEEELRMKEEELERRRRQNSYQESQIESLRIQVQALMAERRQQAAPLQAPPAANNGNVEGPVMCDIRCKVCLSAESNTIFQPCHHISCCSRCAAQLFNNFCPVCRAPITNVLPAYIS